LEFSLKPLTIFLEQICWWRMRRTYYLIPFFVALLLASMQLMAQDSSADASRPAAQEQKPAQHRDTAAARQAEAEGRELLFQKHDVQAAIESFKKCTKLDPWYGHGYIMLGVAYTQAQRWDDAQWAFEEASKIEPENPQAWLGIGSARNEQKDYAGAQKALQQCLDLKPDSAEAHYEMGRTLLGLEKLPAAELQARRAIELNKDYASPHVLMANIYLAEFDANAALAEFRESLRLDPDGPEAGAIKENINMLQKAIAQSAQTKK
jgi:cytochrome c-type biogenesis protein CcmH/NrfG